MSEESAAPQNEDTPHVETTAPNTDTADDSSVVDYRGRYENILPEFTRKSQRLKEYEERYGSLDDQQSEYEDDDEQYAEYEEAYDPDEYRRIARKEAESLLAARDRQVREQQAEENFVNSEIETLERELKEEFSDAEWDFLGNTAVALRDESGKPDVRRAYEHFNGLLEGRKKKWVSGKRSARPGSGPGAAELVDLDDSQARADFIDRVMSEHVPD